MEGHVVEREFAQGGLRQSCGRCRCANLRLRDQQLGEPLRRSGGPQQVAIHFRQGAERARQKAAAQDEGGDRATAHLPAGDVDRTLPDDHDDRPDHQEDDHRRHHRSGADAPLGGREDALDGVAKPGRLALLLVEGLDDLHRAQHLGCDGPHFGDPRLVAGRYASHPPSQDQDRAKNDGNSEQHQSGELGREDEHGGDAADAHDRVTQRHRYRGSHDLLDDRRVDRNSRGNLGRPIFLKKARGHPQQVAVNGEPDVGDGPLAEPGHEIIADGRGNREHPDDRQQQLEPGGDRPRIARTRSEALVDDELETPGNRVGRRGGDQQRERSSGYVAGVAGGEAPHHAETFDRAALGAVTGSNGHADPLTAAGACLK